MKNKVITMTAWRRKDYTKRVIENLENCIGFSEYILLPTIEPGYPEVIKIFDDIPNCEVVVNKKVLGCAANTLKALQRGFEISDFVINMEDDTVPGIDSLKYFEWINKTYNDDKQIFTATAYNRISKLPKPEKYFAAYRCPYFTGWMWATWKDRFEEMAKNWNFRAWDININRNLRKNRYEICPNLPRSQNIGQYFGTYTRPFNWTRCQHSSIWVNNIPNISNILETNMLNPNFLSNLEIQNINELPYFEISSNNSSMCLPECYVIEPEIIIGAIGLVGITYILFKK